MNIMDDIRREAQEQGMTPYRMAKATGGVVAKSTAYRVMAREPADLQLSTLEAICEVLGLALAVQKGANEHQGPDPAGG